jgi:hypothetical protein
VVQIGARVDVCSWCDDLVVVGEFWNLRPRFRMFICAACLKRAAEGVQQAASRLEAPVQRAS